MTEQTAAADMPEGNNEPVTLGFLADLWLAFKAKERQFYTERREIEDRMIERDDLDRHATRSGSKTTKNDDYKISVKDEAKAKLDRENPAATWGALWELCDNAGIVEADMPVKLTREIDVKKLDAIKDANPGLYIELCELIERYPARPSFTIAAK